MAYLIRKALDYYCYEGLKGLTLSALRRLLWYPREVSRNYLWKRLRSQTELTVQIGSIKLSLDPFDSGISRELAIEGTHEPVFTQLLLQIVQEGMTVVDIGANIGYYALQVAERVGSKGHVIAFEPAPRAYALLRQNIEQNHLNNIHALPYAIGDFRGEMDFFLYEQSNWNSFVKHGTPIGKLSVAVYPLDEILPHLSGRVDLIRMDIEGYEVQAVRGMENTLRRHKPIVCLELHSSFIEPPSAVNLLKTLYDIGYDISYLILRSKDEVFLRRLLAPHEKIVEKTCIDHLLTDKRFSVYRENFSLVLSPFRRQAL